MSEPTKVTSGVLSVPKSYPGIPDFTEWHPWGTPPNHTTINENYIPVQGSDRRQFDYSAAMRRLMDRMNRTWKTGAVNNNAPPDIRGVTIGASMERIDSASNHAIQVGKDRAAHDKKSREVFGAKPSDWQEMNELKLVSAYTFRGDTRAPDAVQGAGGFFPPSMRTDEYYMENVAEEFARYLLKMQDRPAKLDAVRETKTAFLECYWHNREGDVSEHEKKMLAEYRGWRAMWRHEEGHIGRMSNRPFLKGYVSTTRDINIAVKGSTGALATDQLDLITAKGWVYALKVDQGFLLKPGVAGVEHTEAEVAHLGPILWKNVYGFRCFTEDPALRNRIWIRYGLDTSDNVAFKLVLGSLSKGLKGEIEGS